MNSSTAFKKVVAIIVTYNGAAWIETCLNSLARSLYPVSTIVIDNRSDDGTISIIEQNFSQVNLVKSDLNLGFGKANNLGMSLALQQGADFVFLLNQDAWVQPDTIHKLVAAAERFPDFGIFSPMQYTASGKRLDPGFESYLRRTYSLAEISTLIRSASETVAEVPFINAAAWLITKSCLMDTGGFGYLFYHYGEDRDYAQRCRYHGRKVGLVSNTTIFHDRESRFTKPNTEGYDKKFDYYFRGTLARCTDINESLLNALWNGLGWSLKETSYYFFTGRGVILPIIFFNVLLKLIPSLREISKYRRAVRSRTKYRFLNIRAGRN